MSATQTRARATRRSSGPPRLAAGFYKAHGLGNDYLVFEEGTAWRASPEATRAVCDPHRGVGADGIVALLADRREGVLRVRMFNADGSEFERSGNGLRVLASYLVRAGHRSPYVVESGGSRVRMVVHGSSGATHDVSVEMGAATLGTAAVRLDARALDTDGTMRGRDGRRILVVPVSVGNPHMVVLSEDLTDERLHEVGPFLAAHPGLARGANVQLARVAERGPSGGGTADALVWERGVGPTSASGTSACAVAAALVSQGSLAPGTVTVRMPGGSMSVDVSAALDIVLRAPVEEVCTGELTAGFLGALGEGEA
jgi:diaminopimelate epimerase